TARRRLAEAASLGLPLIARLGHTPGADPDQATEEYRRLVRCLAPHAHLFCLTTLRMVLSGAWGAGRWANHVAAVLEETRTVASTPRPVLVAVPADGDWEKVTPLIDATLAAGASGLLIDGSVAAEPGGRLIGLPAREPVLSRLREV